MAKTHQKANASLSGPASVNLNQNQWEAVVRDHKKILVLAGAGSGKTKTLL